MKWALWTKVKSMTWTGNMTMVSLFNVLVQLQSTLLVILAKYKDCLHAQACMEPCLDKCMPQCLLADGEAEEPIDMFEAIDADDLDLLQVSFWRVTSSACNLSQGCVSKNNLAGWSSQLTIALTLDFDPGYGVQEAVERGDDMEVTSANGNTPL